MANYQEQFKDFEKALAQYQGETKGLTLVEQSLVGKIWDNTLSFIQDNNIAPGSSIAAGFENFDKPMESFGDFHLANLGAEALVDLCQACKIRNDQMYSAVRNVAHVLLTGGDRTGHFTTGNRAGNEGMGDILSMDQMFSPGMVSTLADDARAGTEAFGVDSDKMYTDLKVTIAITLMKFHKNIIDRIMFRKPCASNMVAYTVPYNEVYDLEKASDKSTDVRNRGDHRVPFIDLYKRPGIVNTEAKRIRPLKANDTGSVSVLIDDDKIAFGHELCLMDLALDGTKFGHGHIDYTDLVSEGVILDTVVIKVTDANGGSATEEFVEMPVRRRGGARFMMTMNGRDSGERSCNFNENVILDNTTVKQGTQTALTALAEMAGGVYVDLDVRLSGQINLKTADLFMQGSVKPVLRHQDGGEIPTASQDAFGELTFELAYYTIDARYSEENMRKSTSAIRMATRPISFEIPVGRNTIVDYSLSETKPTVVLGTVSQAIAIGNDDKAMKLIRDVMGLVYDRLQDEKGGTMFSDHRDRIAFNFVAGQKVYPSIFRGTLDVQALVDSVRSSDALSDIRSAVDKFFLEVFARIYSESMYIQALDGGEKPVFKVVCSNPVLATCFSAQHIHNHLDVKSTADGEQVEFTRVLPDGTILEIITTTFDDMTDKILIIPYRKSAPESELCYGQNCDRGSFVANYTPTSFGATHRRIAVNSREMVFTTNPIGVIIDVANISAVFEGLGSLGATP